MSKSYKLLFKYNIPILKFSSILKNKQEINSIPSLTCLKSGSLNFVRLECGNEVCLVRPHNMRSLPINAELLESLSHYDTKSTIDSNKDQVTCVNNNHQLTDELNYECLDPGKLSVSDYMSHKIESLNWAQRLQVYGKLGKSQLTSFVVISCISGTLMAPIPFDMNTVLLAGIGTGCISLAANTINQILELPYDSQMKRTKNRPIVLGKVTPLHASLFALSSTTAGSVMLLSCNPLACLLGLSNLVLYTAIYTPFKRSSIVNTWIGSVVGGLPPLIGWAAATGGFQQGGLLIFSLLFCWQFPHFMALSWNLKSDYSKAGYQMSSIVNPKLCRSSALRHSFFISLLCPVASVINLTDWCFPIEILPFNVALCYLAYRFYSNPSSSSSRNLFKYTLVYLPILMTLLILNKRCPQPADIVTTDEP